MLHIIRTAPLTVLVAVGLVLGGGSGLAQGVTAPAGVEAEAKPKPPPPIRPQAFPSPEAGVAALIGAVRAHDEARLLRVLGEGARPLIRSGDPVADRAARDRLAAEYAEQHEIVRSAPDRAILQVGNGAWPLPIPLVERGRAWRFDAREGAQALVDRRIGRNELDTIDALRAIVDAQDEYARTAGRQGAFRAYARRFFSTPGRQDGLYWTTTDNEPKSPLGPHVAAAAAGGYAPIKPGDTPRPFHGYLFRMLESQGPAAPGGAMTYVVNGRMIGGFGVIAVPAQYGVSGIQTFLVSHRGEVFQRDLGPATTSIARGIDAFDPGPGWEKVPE